MRSPSRSASASRFSTSITMPSLIAMPSAEASNVRGWPVGESARVLLKQR